MKNKKIKTTSWYMWYMCEKCGKEMYPNADIEKLTGITVCNGTCPHCKDENVTLTPISDFIYASGKSCYWD